MIDPSWFWMAALAAVMLYCVVQAIRDFRAKQYVWAVVAAISAAVLASMPIKSQAVKFDLPALAPR